MTFVVFYLLWAAVSLIGAQYLAYYPMYFILGSNLEHPAWSAIYRIISYALALFLTLYVPKRLLRQKTKITRESLGLTGVVKWSDLALAPIGFAIYTLFATIVTGLFSKFPFFNAEEVQDIGFHNIFFARDKILIFIAIAIVAPIVEEIIFRGWLYGHLRAKIPGRANLFLSILLTSALFGLLHGQWNVGVNVFCLSTVLCALREVTGTIHAGIILHMLKNALAFWLVYMV